MLFIRINPKQSDIKGLHCIKNFLFFSPAVFDDVKTLLIFAGFSYLLSPVLVSLTETIATDTIYAMTTIMLLANLFTHDYGADAEM